MNLKLILNHFFLCLGYLFGSNTSNLGIQTHPIISYHLSIIILNFSAIIRNYLLRSFFLPKL